jgi:hypothetical protein
MTPFIPTAILNVEWQSDLRAVFLHTLLAGSPFSQAWTGQRCRDAINMNHFDL